MTTPHPPTTLMLSVSGMRGIVGESMTPTAATRFAAAYGSLLRQATGAGHPHLVVGRDSRRSGPMVEAAAVAGLVAVGCRVTRLGIATTPGTAVMIRRLEADGGLVITASHNPIAWNGVKLLRHDGVAPPEAQARQVLKRFKSGRLDFVPVDALGDIADDPSADATHADLLLEHLDADLVQRRAPKVVLDSVHGAGGASGRRLLEALGARVVHLYGEPTGHFPHPPEPAAGHLEDLCRAVVEHGADIGFAQDPDADRLAVVDETGRYIGEEYTLALAALRVLGREPGPAAANLSTSRMLDDIAERFGTAVHRTPVGEAHVADAMRREHAVIGGEGNGGVIWPKLIHVRDSLAGMGLVLELLADTGQSVSQLVADLPAYAMEKDKLPIREGLADQAIDRLRRAHADRPIDLQDGIRIDWPDRWIHVRPSNTEPILRLFAEARTAHDARALIADARRRLAD